MNWSFVSNLRKVERSVRINFFSPDVYGCVLHIGKPQSVHNCTVRNDTEGAVDIRCEPGYDGGLSQVFVLEVFSENLDSQEDGEVLYKNMTDRTAPRFSLGKVASGVLYTARMYAANSKGKATPVTLPRFSFPSSENQMGEYIYNILQ